ncbi:MAG TPA: type VI secretion system-associated protein TagF [Sphingomonas sp.]|jgi:type VI secretion system protein ImpM|uniref:type VI secretion system-associated protein TagF n=1 Tax=Sphingomonas sp. TaxID=28214 RepID=UPI002ED7F173
MPGDALTAPTSGMFGKLPAHGDFIRRGDAAVIARLDGWLSAELARIAAADPHALDDRLATLPCWRWIAALDLGVLSGAIGPSHDRVGRCYPLILFTTTPVSDAWFDAADAAIMADSGSAADALLAALPMDPPPAPAPFGWWRFVADRRIDGPDAALPAGAMFDALWDVDSDAEARA